jgi:hypothetical protein
MLTETKQRPISGGGTVTWVGTYSVPFTAAQKSIWQPSQAPTNLVSFVLRPRMPGLHAGDYWMSDDFDAPLPEDFLISEPPHEATT